MHRIILASSSPSRLAVLRNAGVEPQVIAPEVDEDAILAELHAAGPHTTVCTLARAKAAAVAVDSGPEEVSVVIACDSMLLLDGQLSGKPHEVAECIRRWRQQRGRTAELITGHCITIRRPGQADAVSADAVSTLVCFGTPSDADIEAYARTGEPLGCAGAFTLEALGGWFIDGVDGDPSSVLGLSLPLIRRTLAAHELDISDFWNKRG
ncbi:Maf-like protein [Corynebacterium sp. TAE3-ERU12]|uniref:Maf family protein n=1 Tax=Corynebacterium sp. TAE3-ERU12 TaxID=2849491 RepID=UPI001C496450|nr:Maf family nucleotide pyrophosphatase [Corynebacterium sp. TAE3-ERU12]MBV7295576.1 Maf-like protein [Corynebacterium sp. TAE3-ERU12]